MEPVTGVFYKYRAVGEVGSEQWTRLRQIIVDRTIYFARPSTLNDPYDCRPATTAPPAAELRKIAEQMRRSAIKRRGLKGKNPPGVSTATDAVLRLSDPRQRTADVFTALDQRTAVFCTSRTGRSNQQWAYYGDGHRGVCLEFSLPDTETYYAISVTYTNERPTIDVAKFITDDEYRKNALAVAISTKSEDWGHESEVRWLQTDAGVVEYPAELLTGVIAGLATPEMVVDELKAMLRTIEPRPKLYRCEMGLQSYDLEIVEIGV